MDCKFVKSWGWFWGTCKSQKLTLRWLILTSLKSTNKILNNLKLFNFEYRNLVERSSASWSILVLCSNVTAARSWTTSSSFSGNTAVVMCEELFDRTGEQKGANDTNSKLNDLLTSFWKNTWDAELLISFFMRNQSSFHPSVEICIQKLMQYHLDTLYFFFISKVILTKTFELLKSWPPKCVINNSWIWAWSCDVREPGESLFHIIIDDLANFWLCS